MSDRGSLTDREHATLWCRQFGVFDDFVYGYLKGQAETQRAAERAHWWQRARLALGERRRARMMAGKSDPVWTLKDRYWRWMRAHFPAYVERLDERDRARRQAARAANPAAVTLSELAGARHILSHARFAPPTREAFAASDPLDEAYIGRLETSLVRDRRERGSEWA